MQKPASGKVAFIGGGNMASAIVGGLVAAGRATASIIVVEPDEAQRGRLLADLGVAAQQRADAALAEAELVVWAVKPQVFAAAAAPCAPHVAEALQLSIMAGVRSDAIVAATASERVVRAMPNTPALIGEGVAGLFARAAVSAADRDQVEAVLKPTGELVWVAEEDALDAVTALSGSGPAYVFYLIESMLEAGRRMGLDEADARLLAVQTVRGSAALAASSTDPAETLRRKVTSPGGTTYAAMALLEAREVKAAFVDAIVAARDRACELGRPDKA